MSRYNLQVTKRQVLDMGLYVEDDGPFNLVYGWDPPLRTFFVHLEREVDQISWFEIEEKGWNEKEIEEYFDNLPEEILFALDNQWTLIEHPKFPGKTRWSNEEMFEIVFDHINLPTRHKEYLQDYTPF